MTLNPSWINTFQKERSTHSINISATRCHIVLWITTHCMRTISRNITLKYFRKKRNLCSANAAPTDCKHWREKKNPLADKADLLILVLQIPLYVTFSAAGGPEVRSNIKRIQEEWGPNRQRKWTPKLFRNRSGRVKPFTKLIQARLQPCAKPAMAKLHSVKEWTIRETRSWLLVQGETQSQKLLWSLWWATLLTLRSGHSEHCECVDSDKATWGKCSADH